MDVEFLMTYDAYDFTRLEAMLQSNDIDQISSAMLYMTNGVADIAWVQRRYVDLTTHSNDDVRGLALTCLGHVARIHGSVDWELVMPVLNRMLLDPLLGGRAQDAIDDIEMFVGNVGDARS